MTNIPSLKEMVDMVDAGTHFTTERYEEVLKYVLVQISPYMLAIDAMVKDTGYGVLDIKLHIRAGEVDKIDFIQSKTWLKAKEV